MNLLVNNTLWLMMLHFMPSQLFCVRKKRYYDTSANGCWRP